MSEVATLPSWLGNISELISRKNERYKYTDFSFLSEIDYVPSSKSDVEYLRAMVDARRLKRPGSRLLVLVNGHYAPEISDTAVAPGVSVTSIQKLQVKDEPWPASEVAKFPFASLNMANYNDGIFIQVDDKCHIEAPIHILSISVGAEPFHAHTKNIIKIGSNSKIELYYEYLSDTVIPYVMNDVDVVSMGENAIVEINKLQRESVKANHFSHTFVSQQKNSSLRYHVFALGGRFYRDDIVVDLLGRGAECKTAGFYRLSHDGQYMDNHVDVNHKAEHSYSEMLYKGVLDKKSCAVFNGRLHVEKDAQKIVAYQENHNILLSKLAEVYSKPELEIYADDVKCKHGATIGQIDQDALFYMRARGIKKDVAMTVLLQGFAQELLQKVSSPIVRDRIKELMSAK